MPVDLEAVRRAKPIPGQNFTSDTKSYPWHQPPKYVKLSEALDYLVKIVTNKKKVHDIVTMMELDFPLVKISQTILMLGVGDGKWTVDLALLLCGPLTKILEMVADQMGVEYKLGLEDDETIPTGTFFKGISEMEKTAKDSNGVMKIVKAALPEIKAEAEAQEGADTGVGEAAPEKDIQDSGAEVMGGFSKPPAKGVK